MIIQTILKVQMLLMKLHKRLIKHFGNIAKKNDFIFLLFVF